MGKKGKLNQKSRAFFLLTSSIGFGMILVGCTEPESIGRFRATPVTTIILDDLGVIDEDPAVFSGARPAGPADMIIVESEYVIGPGDTLAVTINDLYDVGLQYREALRVNEIGRITLPEVGTILAGGRTELELTRLIEDRLSPQIILRPIVSVLVMEPRKKVYSVSGAVAGPGTYQLWESDYRLAQALAQAGGIPQANSDYAYVIRKVEAGALTDDRERGEGNLREEGVSTGTSRGPEKISTEGNGPRFEQTQTAETRDPVELLEALEREQLTEEQRKTMRLIRRGDKFVLAPIEGALPSEEPAEGSGLRRPGERREGLSYEALERSGLAQEVIRIDLRKLRGGDWRQNIILRPGDDIHVPLNAAGVFQVMGQVSRPGAYSLAGERMTLKQAIATAGPLMATAWPSRCEIIRRVGENKQVTCLVNLDKLFTGASPDYYIKPNDIINVGSHPLARWMAVVRQSFRSTYGFGFVYDRNFADVDFGR